MWPTGVFLTCGVAAGVLTGLPAVRRVLSGVSGAIGIGGVSLLLAIAAFRNVDAFAPVQSAKTAGERVARPLVDQFSTVLLVATGLPARSSSTTRPAPRSENTSRTPSSPSCKTPGSNSPSPWEDDNLLRFALGKTPSSGEATTRIVLADAGGDPEPV